MEQALSSMEKLKLAVFSKTWPVGSGPGGMERHAATLYTTLAASGHEIHVFTSPSDRKSHEDIQDGNLHVHFVANDHGTVNCSLGFDIFNRENAGREFDYVHKESVFLLHWRARTLARVAATWHGIWYEIMHSKLFQELLTGPGPTTMADLEEAMPRLVDEKKFFKSYTQHICISDSAGEVLVNIYQLPRRNVHVILNGDDPEKFRPDPNSGLKFRKKHRIPINASFVMGVAGRLVRDKGHPLLYKAFSSISSHHPGVFVMVAGSGPWARRYAELGPNVRVLGEFDPSKLTQFYNTIDVFVNPTLRPQGLDLTLMEVMPCGTAVLAPNYPSITGTVVPDGRFGYTFSPNTESLVEVLETAIGDGQAVLKTKGAACKDHAVSMFTVSIMASAYERFLLIFGRTYEWFFVCMKNNKYCHYPLPTDC